MNTPNKLTVLRILLIPVFLVFLMIDSIPHHFLWALILFAVASLTDLVDGKLARRYNMVTDFGKFLDPLADKMLVTSALICFVELGLTPSVAVVVIVFREFLVTSLRLVASGSGKVVAANIWGKLKTTVQMSGIVGILFFSELQYAGVIPASFDLHPWFDGVMWLAAALTLASGATYVWENRKFINTTK